MSISLIWLYCWRITERYANSEGLDVTQVPTERCSSLNVPPRVPAERNAVIFGGRLLMSNANRTFPREDSLNDTWVGG